MKQFLYLFVLIVVLISTTKAQWSTNPNTNTPICIVEMHQQDPIIVSDGAGGYIIGWIQYSTESNADIYTQRLNILGNRQWFNNGNLVTNRYDSQFLQNIVSDGTGGAFFVWRDLASSGSLTRIQYLNQFGAPKIKYNGDYTIGLPLPPYNYQYSPQVILSDSNNVIVIWSQYRPNELSNYRDEIFGQKIDSVGTIKWISSIYNLYNTIIYYDGYQGETVMVSDDSSGGILAWIDKRNGNADIFVQRINSVGEKKWLWNGNYYGIPISTDSSLQFNCRIVSDDSSGAILIWLDSRNNVTDTMIIRAQHISCSGQILWNNGLMADTISRYFYSMDLTKDGAGGVIVVWQQYSDTASKKASIYAQRIDGSGNLLWPNQKNRVLVTNSAYYAGKPKVINDGAGGAIVVWANGQYGSLDIYAQHISSGGTFLWSDSGTPITTAFSNQFSPSIVTDGAGGAIVVWIDGRNSSLDIYAQQINSQGVLGVVTGVEDQYPQGLPNKIELGINYPNPFNPSTRIDFSLPKANYITLKVYNILGVEVANLFDGKKEAGQYSFTFNSANLSSGIYFYRLAHSSGVLTRKMVILK